MSRVAKNPINIPTGVDVSIKDGRVTVKGPKGLLTHDVHPSVQISHEGSVLTFAPRKTKAGESWALAGTTRAILNNLVTGVREGFERKLSLVGVGYRAQSQGKVLNLSLGFSHPVAFSVPEGISIDTPSQTEIVVKGIDKQLVGETAARIRAVRPPEPYKGKGVRYADETVILKEAKKK